MYSSRVDSLVRFPFHSYFHFTLFQAWCLFASQCTVLITTLAFLHQPISLYRCQNVLLFKGLLHSQHSPRHLGVPCYVRLGKIFRYRGRSVYYARHVLNLVTNSMCTATFFEPGPGACGHINNAQDFIVAVSAKVFDTFP